MSEGQAQPERLSTREVRRQAHLSKEKARGLTLLSILAVLLSPFSIPTFGLGIALGVVLIIASVVLRRQGYRAGGPLAAGVIAVVVGATSAGACGWFVLRTAEVTGKEELRQDRVGDRFEEAFENSERGPSSDGGVQLRDRRDGGAALDADSPVPAPPPHEESRR